MESAAGVFASRAAAEKARAALVASGIAAERIAISAPLTRDGIAAEAPGESYENQGERDSPADSERARFGEAVRSGVCVLTVSAGDAHEVSRLHELMQREGARLVRKRP